jgi:acetate kinase
MRVLTINAGSSSVRLAVLEESPEGLRRAAASHRKQLPPDTAISLQEFLTQSAAPPFDLIAHRIVHGGEKLVETCVIDPSVEAEIERLAPLAPLHNPASLAWVRACRAVIGPDVPQFAVFDTAFYAGLPPVARQYALPRELTADLHLRRFGFHGLAHQGMLQHWRRLEPSADPAARVISLQLGAGCSITASRGGVPLDTSMGFSPLEGLIMATRSGDVDAGLLLHLQRTLSLSPDRLEHVLNTGSGLLGVSGISGDMRTLLESDTADARLAVELYGYRARKYVGAYLAVLGGADAVLFGGGVGENAPAIREQILRGLQWAGIHIDAEANRSAVGIPARIDTASSGGQGAAIWTLPVDESLRLAEEALRACRPAPEERHRG